MNKLDKQTSDSICSGQVITSLPECVKELVDNGIDSGATSIQINLKESGLDWIEVVDDGSGIREEDHEILCHRSTTSKMSAFEDLPFLESLGFRGEALHSLCSLSQSVTIITRVADSPIGHNIEYDKEGNIVTKKVHPRTKGTTVRVNKLFSRLPVRQKYMETQLKGQLNKLSTMLMGYYLSNPNIRLSLHDTSNNSRKMLFNGLQFNDLAQRMSSVLKPLPAYDSFKWEKGEGNTTFIDKEVANELNVNLEDEDVESYCSNIALEGCISTPGQGRSSGDMQFVAINKRPVDLTKLCKIVNQVFRSYDPTGNGSQYPMFVLNAFIPTNWLDVNVTPDKRTVMLSHENLFHAIIKSHIISLFGSNSNSLEQSMYSKSCSQITVVFEKDKNGLSQTLMTDYLKEVEQEVPPHIDPPTVTSDPGFITATEQMKRMGEPSKETPCQPDEVYVSSYIRRKSRSRSREDGQTLESSTLGRITPPGGPPSKRMKCSTPNQAPNSEESVELGCGSFGRNLERSRPKARTIEGRGYTSVVKNKNLGQQEVQGQPQTSGETGPTTPQDIVIEYDENVIPIRRHFDVNISMEYLEEAETMTTQTMPSFTHSQPDQYESEEIAILEMKRELKQSDFKKFQIIGQFNKGFILCQLGKALFVIDQHAADERYNFDQLMEEFEFSSQPLLSPHHLNLSNFEEGITIANLPVFKKNGFVLNVNESNNVGQKVTITSVPHTGNHVLGVEDAEELIQNLVAASSLSSSFRPSRIKDILASKACRKSIMIHDELATSDIRRLLDKLSETQYPWTCAHGRPTTSFLGDVNFKVKPGGISESLQESGSKNESSQQQEGMDGAGDSVPIEVEAPASDGLEPHSLPDDLGCIDDLLEILQKQESCER